MDNLESTLVWTLYSLIAEVDLKFPQSIALRHILYAITVQLVLLYVKNNSSRFSNNKSN